jgi:hypothetical protein
VNQNSVFPCHWHAGVMAAEIYRIGFSRFHTARMTSPDISLVTPSSPTQALCWMRRRTKDRISMGPASPCGRLRPRMSVHCTRTVARAAPREARLHEGRDRMGAIATTIGIDVSKDRLGIQIRGLGAHFHVAEDAEGIAAVIARRQAVAPRPTVLKPFKLRTTPKTWPRDF